MAISKSSAVVVSDSDVDAGIVLWKSCATVTVDRTSDSDVAVV